MNVKVGLTDKRWKRMKFVLSVKVIEIKYGIML